MADTTINMNKRRMWIAVMLSLISPGLGQIYCGKLARGLFLNILNAIPFSLIAVALLFKDLSTLILTAVGLTIFGGIIELIAIIDSIYLVKQVGRNYELKEYNKWYIYLLLIFVGAGSGSGTTSYIRNNISEAFRVPTSSMYPTIIPNNRVLTNKTVYSKFEPKRGDVIVYINPENRRQNQIKRVVAIAGDRVEMKNDQLYINGQMLQYQPLSKTEIDALNINDNDPNFQGNICYEINGIARYKIFLKRLPNDNKKYDFAEIIVPKYNCFVLGDHRNNSHDSRNYGPIPIATIKGKATWLYWPLPRFGKVE